MSVLFRGRPMVAVSVLVLLAGGAVAAEPPPGACDARATLQALNQARRSDSEKLAAPYPTVNAGTPVCAALLKVLGRLAARERSGGRKLEGDKPLDLALAQSERAAALSDAATRAEVERLQAQEPDADRRALLEASIFHLNGHYLARDLVLSTLPSGTSK